MRNPKKSFVPTESHKYPTEIEEGYFRPLQIEINGNFDKALKIFRTVVQSEQIIANYKRRMSYEKPSVKRRRKQQETLQRLWEEEIKAQKVASGEYEKEKQRQQEKKERKLQEKYERAMKATPTNE